MNQYSAERNVTRSIGGDQSQARILARLKRDRPDLAQRVINGELTPRQAAQESAAIVVLIAERRLGELCQKITGGKGNKSPHNTKTLSVSVLLSDLDITHNQSQRWQQLAAIVVLIAERRLGEFCKETDFSKGAAAKRGSPAEPRLDDLGITKKQSHNWQQLAAIAHAASPTPSAEFSRSSQA